ncbi:acyl-CoA dehydrogenase family protein [Streptomyces sp. NPDC093509]|uniref:acyl-CoA dehydrogenase family protein n=1 Tax=Streptomyces sp. NPDC093509 TaxID=3154982 RepID=UPI00344D97F1
MSSLEDILITIPAKLAPSIEAAVEDMEAGLGLPRTLLQELRDSGSFRMLTPRDYGGFESSIETVLKVYEGFGRIDASVAWLVWNANWGFVGALLSEEGASRIWGDGDEPIFANSGAPGVAMPIDRGYLLSGNWKIVSGIGHADWLTVVGVVMQDGSPLLADNGSPDTRLFVLNREQVSIKETWKVSGMLATESNDVFVNEAFVPDELTVRIDAPARIQRPPYRGFIPALVLPGCTAVVLGVAQAAINETVALALSKKMPNGEGSLSNSPHVQAAIARCEASLHAARLLLMSAAREMDSAGASGNPVTLEQRAALRAAMSHAAHVSRQVLVEMYELGSSSSLYRKNILERLFRDGMVALQHVNHSAVLFEAAGRVRFGLAPGRSLF